MRKIFRGTSLYLLLLVIIIFAVTMFGKDVEPVKQLNVTELINNIEIGRASCRERV